MSGTRFVRFYPSDWRSGCIGLTPEEQGFYLMVCAHFWETGARLPADDMMAASRLMVDVRMYRRLRDKLIQKGKLHAADDGYFNPRAEREYQAATRAAEKEAAKADVGASRGQDDREHQDGRDQVAGRVGSAHSVSASSADAQADFGETSGRLRGEVSENYEGKVNEINDPLKSLTGLKKERENNSVCQSEAAPASGQTDPNFEKCKRELNGSTTRIIETLIQSFGNYGTKQVAAAWLADLLDDQGRAAVIEAFRFLEDCEARGQPVRDVKRFLSKNAAREREKAEKATVAKSEASREAQKRALMRRF